MKKFMSSLFVLLVCVFMVTSLFVQSARSSTWAQDTGRIRGEFPDGMVGEKYRDYSSVEVDYDSSTWKVISGTLPPGLQLNKWGWLGGGDALLEGIPTKAGSYTFTVLVTFKDKSSLTKTFDVTIVENPDVMDVVIVGAFAAGKVNKPYSSSITISNGTPPYKWVYKGKLPRGLKLKGLNSETLILSGTPKESGNFEIGVAVSDKFSSSKPQLFDIMIE